MKVWLQRVTEASVEIDGASVAQIGTGYLALLGVGVGDTPSAAEALAARAVHLRVFEDESGKINKSVQDVAGEILVVSQFTLYADTAHGRRPGFSNAARPEVAEPLYEHFVACLRRLLGPSRVQTGRFGAYMKVRLLNDGPFSVELLA